ncbi:MAG TPA: hypothetical protein DEB39_06130 [Planctomycetaceae bacterium]|nr:hypothetical protein [Planctomycetaceae bacterium]
MALESGIELGKRYSETEMFSHFHDGPFGRCPDCGRMVFLPCLACLTEQDGDVADPAETVEAEPMCIHLDGDERQRYEYVRLEKIAEEIRRSEKEPYA